jgi:hypothetical protein
MCPRLIFLNVLLVLVLFCASSFGKYSGGSGEPNNPYRIATPNDLNSIGLDPCDWDKHFLMTADINMASIVGGQFNIIGSSMNPFAGVFDGNEHTIVKFTYSEHFAFYYSALFSVVDGPEAIIKNVIMADADVNDTGGRMACLVGNLKKGLVSNCHIINSRVNAENYAGLLVGLNDSQVIYSSSSGVCSAMQYVGGLVGVTSNQGIIMNCFSDANVISNWGGIAGGLVGYHDGDLIIDCHSTGRIEGLGSSGEVGGLVGDNRSVIEQCYSTAEVIGGNDEGIGGLVGVNNETGTVSKCFATGDVSGIIDVGGLVGYNYDGGVISDSYSHGDVNALSYACGLVSGNWGIIQRCYSTGNVIRNGSSGRGLVSHNHDTVAECFWDTEASDCNDSDGGVGLPTAQMQKRSTFADAGWDMVNVWDIGENQTYPFLRTHLPSDINKDGETNLYDFAIIALNWLSGEWQ